MDFLYTTWEYILVFLMAATPWVEILLVIPVAIAAGLSPFWVTVIAFIGNALPVLLIVALYEKWEQWRSIRRDKREALSTDEPMESITDEPSISVEPTEEGQTQEEATTEQPSKRGKRARKIWDRYGLPGLALLAPAITGIHLAAVMAFAFKSPKRATAIWMTISLALWAVGTGIVSYYGLEWFDWIRQ